MVQTLNLGWGQGVEPVKSKDVQGLYRCFLQMGSM